MATDRDLAARVDRLEIIVGGLLDELIECKEALKGAEEHLARSAQSTNWQDLNTLRGVQQQAQSTSGAFTGCPTQASQAPGLPGNIGSYQAALQVQLAGSSNAGKKNYLGLGNLFGGGNGR